MFKKSGLADLDPTSRVMLAQRKLAKVSLIKESITTSGNRLEGSMEVEKRDSLLKEYSNLQFKSPKKKQSSSRDRNLDSKYEINVGISSMKRE